MSKIKKTCLYGRKFCKAIEVGLLIVTKVLSTSEPLAKAVPQANGRRSLIHKHKTTKEGRHEAFITDECCHGCVQYAESLHTFQARTSPFVHHTVLNAVRSHQRDATAIQHGWRELLENALTKRLSCRKKKVHRSEIVTDLGTVCRVVKV